MTETAGSEQPLPPPRPETPYVGLVPYREEDFGLFFGRDDERRIVTANLRASRLTILYEARTAVSAKAERIRRPWSGSGSDPINQAHKGQRQLKMDRVG